MPLAWQHHIRSKAQREELAKRFKNPKDPFKIVIVRDMWLTGFDAPPLHTMYMDKPMSGHGLMQAIARVNRVFKDKPGGLDCRLYWSGLNNCRQALANYTPKVAQGKPQSNRNRQLPILLKKYEICLGIFYSFNWSKWTIGKPPAERLGLLPISSGTHLR